MVTSGNSNGTVMDGIRMLDLGRYQAGPRCGLMFARMGAEVIKVESLSGDESRRNGPTVRGQSAYWVQYNSGKKSLAINLRTDEGKAVLRDLVKVSDILLQNFRPGTIDIMGFGYEKLKELNPKIVMINVSAYGQYGPYAERIGFDHIGQAIGGMMAMTGNEGDPPIRTHFPLIDRITALHATIGALGGAQGAGVFRRRAGDRRLPGGHGVHGERDPGVGVPGNRRGRGARGQRARHDQLIPDVGRLGVHRGQQRGDVGKVVRLHSTSRSGWRTSGSRRGPVRRDNADAVQEELTQWFAARTTKDAVDHLSSLFGACGADSRRAWARRRSRTCTSGRSWWRCRTERRGRCTFQVRRSSSVVHRW